MKNYKKIRKRRNAQARTKARIARGGPYVVQKAVRAPQALETLEDTLRKAERRMRMSNWPGWLG